MKDWGTTHLDVMNQVENLHYEQKDAGNILVILSGGMDSATCLAVAKEINKRKGGLVEGITFDYGQQHDKEIYEI